MRKKGIGIIITIFLIMIVGTMTAFAAEIEQEENTQVTVENIQEPNTDIFFDADAVTNRTAAKSALADMHGVFVFRSAFIEQEEIVKRAERDEREATVNLVLGSSQPEPDYREWVDLVLDAHAEKYIKDVYIEKEKNSIFMWIYCIIFSICLLCMAIRIEDYLKRKKNGCQKTKSSAITGMLIWCVCVPMFLLAGCSFKINEKTIVQSNDEYIQNEDAQELMKMDANSILWIKEENDQQIQLYVSRGSEFNEIDCRNVIAEIDDIIQCEYEDTNGDGRNDILLTTNDEIWVFIQEESGNYVLWDEGTFRPIKKRV